jgi:exodeoxyribonuclease VII large subunit
MSPKKPGGDDLFAFGQQQAAAEKATPAPGANAPRELSVSELSQLLKRTVEEAFAYVRVRGELSRITVAKSGHLYTDLKDADSVLAAICWKGTLGRLNVRPEEGMDVIVTGRLTTYPGRSNYQLIIETMELAGQGALLKLLEDRRKKLAAEGLFDAARKRPLPFLPRRIGVVTSPTGAVIRDILHRLADRCPSHVIVWPVAVQGAGAAAEVTAAIRGFNALPPDHPLRPDLLIVARGGGSLEDLMAFNDETVVRAAAASAIPLISAVGHETDTTLIDFAADLRAPTPTAAAEKAVPVRRDLAARLADDAGRLQAALRQKTARARVDLQGVSRALGPASRLLEARRQRLDMAAQRLDHGLIQWLSRQQLRLRDAAARLSPRLLSAPVAENRRHLARLDERLRGTAPRLLREPRQKLSSAAALLQSLSFERVLERGYAVVFDAQGNIVSSKAKVAGTMTLRLKDGDTAIEAADHVRK